MNYFDEREISPDKHSLAGNLEEIRIRGYTVIEDLITAKEADLLSGKVDAIYETQLKEIGGPENLDRIGETGVARNLVDYDPSFLNLITNENLLFMVGSLLGKYFKLMYQSGIVNTPNVDKYPSSWHRDLIHQNFTTSKPMAITVIICVDDFTMENGGTGVLPFSHKLDFVPSSEFIKESAVSIVARKGSVLLLDSMLLHKTGHNTSKSIRRAVVNVYCLPFINQPFYFSEKILDACPEKDKGLVRKMLGFTTRSSPHLTEYRKGRL